MRVVKITPGKPTTLDQARAEIKKGLLKQLVEAKIDDIANAYMDASSGGASLTAAATKTGMHTGHVAAMDKDGLAPDGSKAAAPNDPSFRAPFSRPRAAKKAIPSKPRLGIIMSYR